MSDLPIHNDKDEPLNPASGMPGTVADNTMFDATYGRDLTNMPPGTIHRTDPAHPSHPDHAKFYPGIDPALLPGGARHPTQPADEVLDAMKEAEEARTSGMPMPTVPTGARPVGTATDAGHRLPQDDQFVGHTGLKEMNKPGSDTERPEDRAQDPAVNRPQDPSGPQGQEDSTTDAPVMAPNAPKPEGQQRAEKGQVGDMSGLRPENAKAKQQAEESKGEGEKK